jgi:hypothetical protein
MKSPINRRQFGLSAVAGAAGIAGFLAGKQVVAEDLSDHLIKGFMVTHDGYRSLKVFDCQEHIVVFFDATDSPRFKGGYVRSKVHESVMCFHEGPAYPYPYAKAVVHIDKGRVTKVVATIPQLPPVPGQPQYLVVDSEGGSHEIPSLQRWRNA